MAEIRFDDGLVRYTINGKADVCFNPTDVALAERLYTAFEKLDGMQEAVRDELNGGGDARAILDFTKARDAEMRDIIDAVFGAPVSEAVFGGINVYAMADGLPIWANLMLAVLDEVQAAFEREGEQVTPRLAKYSEKYTRAKK